MSEEIKTMESAKIVQTTATGKIRKPNNHARVRSIKRRYWIEWETHFDKFPSPEILEEKDKKLRKYVEDYLRELFKNHKQHYSGALTDEGYPEMITDDIGDYFAEDTEDTDPKKEKLPPDLYSVEFKEYRNGSWHKLTQAEYEAAVKENENLPDEKRRLLRYMVITEKWMDLLVTTWVQKSAQPAVFVYRGWFEGKNNIRLTSTPDSKGSMTPPNPPPPPVTV